MGSVYYLDIDSGERDTSEWPLANCYVVDLKTPIYDVTGLEIVSARVPTSQSAIHDNNSRFSVEILGSATDAGVHTVDITSREINSGSSLATKIQDALTAAGIVTIDSVSFLSTRSSLVFQNTATSNDFTLLFKSGVDGWDSNVSGRTCPNQVLGFTASDVTSQNGRLDLEGKVDYECGPKTYVVRVSSGAVDFTQDVFTNTPFYTGTFMSTGVIDNQYITLSGTDDAVTHDFKLGSHKEISQLRVEFFYKENNKLIPIDFRGRDHALKLKITGNTDKLAGTSREVEHDLDLPPPIDLPEKEVHVYEWKKYVPIAFVLLMGMLLIWSISG